MRQLRGLPPGFADFGLLVDPVLNLRHDPVQIHITSSA
jgi:hypothetical protein